MWGECVRLSECVRGECVRSERGRGERACEGWGSPKCVWGGGRGLSASAPCPPPPCRCCCCRCVCCCRAFSRVLAASSFRRSSCLARSIASAAWGAAAGRVVFRVAASMWPVSPARGGPNPAVGSGGGAGGVLPPAGDAGEGAGAGAGARAFLVSASSFPVSPAWGGAKPAVGSDADAGGGGTSILGCSVAAEADDDDAAGFELFSDEITSFLRLSSISRCPVSPARGAAKSSAGSAGGVGGLAEVRASRRSPALPRFVM